MCFIVFSFLFDMFKWVTFLVSASIEISNMNDFEREQLMNLRSKQIKTTLYTTQGILLLVFLGFFIYGLTIVNELDQNSEFFFLRNIILISIGLIILILYVIIFIKLYRRLKEQYQHYYLKHRQILLGLFYTIIFSMISRTVFLILFTIKEVNELLAS